MNLGTVITVGRTKTIAAQTKAPDGDAAVWPLRLNLLPMELIPSSVCIGQGPFARANSASQIFCFLRTSFPTRFLVAVAARAIFADTEFDTVGKFDLPAGNHRGRQFWMFCRSL